MKVRKIKQILVRGWVSLAGGMARGEAEGAKAWWIHFVFAYKNK
jgi:hypothetical protein